MWLVTGVSGQVGSVLLRALRRSGAQVAGLASPRTRGTAREEGVTPFDLTDLRALEAQLVRIEPNVIIHVAAVSSVAAAHADPARARAVNAASTRCLADYAASRRARLIYVSTDMVFDGEAAPYGEDAVPRPLSAYGSSKLAGEQAAATYSGAVVARLPLLYGVPAAPRETTFVKQLSALRESRELTLFRDEYRTPLSLEDAASSLIRLAHSEYQGLLHLGGPERLSRLEMGERMADALGIERALVRGIESSSIDSPEPRPRDLSFDSSRFLAEFGVPPGRPMREALAGLNLREPTGCV